MKETQVQSRGIYKICPWRNKLSEVRQPHNTHQDPLQAPDGRFYDLANPRRALLAFRRRYGSWLEKLLRQRESPTLTTSSRNEMASLYRTRNRRSVALHLEDRRIAWMIYRKPRSANPKQSRESLLPRHSLSFWRDSPERNSTEY